MADNRRPPKGPIGVYIPPAKRLKQEKLEIGSIEHQREQWNEHKRKITGLINRANLSNITFILKELFSCNLIRYKGLLASALMKAQEASPDYTNVYAAILAVINSKIKNLGKLIIDRLILEYRISFVSKNKQKCIAIVKFFAHLTNQGVIDEVLAFELIHHLINKPTPDSIEIVTQFIKECGARLEQLDPVYLSKVFSILRELSQEAELDSRTLDLIDFAHNIRKEKFKDFPSIKPELDLIDERDKLESSHSVELSGPRKDDFHMEYNYFKEDPNWLQNEAAYDKIKRELLDDDDEGSEISDSDEESDEEEPKVSQEIVDATGSNPTKFRRDVYLTIKSSIRHEEVVHKLMKSKINPGQYDELCQMILDCCGQERTYEPIFGLIASKLCQLKHRDFSPRFTNMFKPFYDNVHRFEQNKMRNIAKFYAHLLTTESIDWSCLVCLKLRENATSSAGRCFIKLLFEELVSILSLKTLKEYIKDPSRGIGFTNLLPMDQEEDIRFAVNFFTFSGMGDLTVDMREQLISRQQ